MTWRLEANCRDADLAIFFPAADQGPRAYRAARAICASCSVQAECLDFILPFEMQGWRQGMFGGLTPGERDKLRFRVRFCDICGRRFTPTGSGDRRYCDDVCQEIGYAARNYRHREKVA